MQGMPVEGLPSPRRLILTNFQSPGDVVMLTAAVRDLHRAHPGRFLTDVRTSAASLWDYNPWVTPLSEDRPGVTTVPMHYPLIHQSNRRPYHFIHGFVQYLEEQVGLAIPVTDFRGDIYLSEEECCQPPHPMVPAGLRYWVLVAGGKYDFTAKWWDPASFQQVVTALRGRVRFVQCGEASHWHPRLDHTLDLVGKTSTRQLIQLIFHAQGVLSPVTLAMHLAAAVPVPPGGPAQRPCVVVAGGREPPQWEAYPQHQYLSTSGALDCCQDGGCWRSRCQLLHDGDSKDHENVCLQPVQVRPDLRIARCMQMITPADVLRRIEYYYDGGILSWN
jgi:ADP-heptose:LPS heptosyltransferase